MPFPNKNSQFKKGKSGNPNGRPLGLKNRSTVVKKWLEITLRSNNPLTGVDEEMTAEDKITLTQISLAINGKTDAYKVLMDSAYGSASSLELNGSIGVDTPIAETSKSVLKRIEDLKNELSKRNKRNRKRD